MKKVNIDLRDPSTLDNVIEELDKFCEVIDKLTLAVVKRLVDEGVSIARVKYASAIYAGTNDVSVEGRMIDDHTGVISANGNSVLFIEFGTGITKADNPMERAEVSGNVMPHGWYGSGRGANPKGWFYKGKMPDNAPSGTEPARNRDGIIHTYGNDANSCLYFAREELEREFKRIVQEEYAKL